MAEENILEQLYKISARIDKGERTEVTVLGKTYSVGDTKKHVLDKILQVQFNAKYYNASNNRNSLKKRLRYINSSDARVASYLLLNSLSYIPLLHAIHWRWLNRVKTSETLNAIIEAGMNNNENAFFLKSSVSAQTILMTRMQMIKVEQE